jgi:hypothetical protein
MDVRGAVVVESLSLILAAMRYDAMRFQYNAVQCRSCGERSDEGYVGEKGASERAKSGFWDWEPSLLRIDYLAWLLFLDLERERQSRRLAKRFVWGRIHSATGVCWGSDTIASFAAVSVESEGLKPTPRALDE